MWLLVMSSKSRNIVRVIVEILFVILSTKLTENGESAFQTYQNKEAGGVRGVRGVLVKDVVHTD